MQKVRWLFVLIVLLSLFIPHSFAFAEDTLVNIGVLAKRGDEFAEKTWGATAEYLSQTIQSYRFSIVPLGFDEIIPAVENQSVDFILANPSIYIGLEMKYGFTRIATLNNRVGDLISNQFGGVVFTHSSRTDIARLKDIEGKRVMGVEKTSLGGYLMALGVFQDRGIDLGSMDLSFGLTHDNVVYAVLDGRADAGLVRTDTLERMSEEGLIDLAEFRILGHIEGEEPPFPFQHSTPLYPEWPFASASYTPKALAQSVAVALLGMPADSQAAQDSRSAGWAIPLNYQSVHELLKQLKAGPYVDYGKITYKDVFRLYWHWLILGLIAITVLSVLSSYVTRLNFQLTASKLKLHRLNDELEQRVEKRTRDLASTNAELEEEIKERINAQKKLVRLSEENRLLLDCVGEGIFGIDVDGKLMFVNPAAMDMLGRTKEELMGDSMHVLTHHTRANGEPYPESECPIHSVIQTRKLETVLDDVFWRKDGSGFPVEYTSTPIIDNGQLKGAVVVFKDISERKQMEQHLQQASVVFDTTAEGILVTDAQNKVISVNPAFSAITGYREDEILGQTPNVLNSGYHTANFYREMWEQLREAGHWSGEIWNRKKGGELYPEWLSINVVKDSSGNVLNYIAVFTDISLIKDTEQRLEYLAHHDPLTKLPNRLLLEDRLSHAIKTAHRNRSRLAVMFLDLDNFKKINDTLGHEYGDAILSDVANRLQGCLREGDTVARFGGDEFIIVLEQISDTDRVMGVADKILETIYTPMTHKGKSVLISTSIGISIYPDDGSKAETLLRHADAAMYSAKEEGRNCFAFYQSANTV